MIVCHLRHICLPFRVKLPPSPSSSHEILCEKEKLFLIKSVRVRFYENWEERTCDIKTNPKLAN